MCRNKFQILIGEFHVVIVRWFQVEIIKREIILAECIKALSRGKGYTLDFPRCKGTLEPVFSLI